MNEYWKKYKDIQADLETVQSIMEATLHSRIPLLDEAFSGLSITGGKLLRPAFLIISGRFGNPDETKLHRMAAAVEMLHMATLVHDDILDEADSRRGKPSVHKLYGERKAVLIGDYLFSLSFNLIAEYAAPENAKRLSRAAMDILTGEITQTAGLYILKKSIREYLQRITGKTAALFAASCYTGALESGVPEPMAAILRRIGYNIGMGFQIIDDILDYESTESRIGKPTGNDLRNGVFTLPLILSYDGTEDGRKDPLSSLLAHRPYSDETISSIISIVRDRNGLERAREFAARYTDRANREIAKLPECRPRELLSFLSEELLARSY